MWRLPSRSVLNRTYVVTYLEEGVETNNVSESAKKKGQPIDESPIPILTGDGRTRAPTVTSFGQWGTRSKCPH
jgi:hypothetical protein